MQEVPNIQNKGIVFFAAAVVVLLAVSPLLQNLTITPRKDYFTELYIYGSSHNAAYPYVVSENNGYLLYIDVANHQGENTQYMLQMKFRSSDQPGPGSFNKTSSTQPALESTTFTVSDEEVYELPIQVSFQYSLSQLSHQVDMPDRVEMQSITANGNPYSLQGTSLNYDSSKYGFFGNLFFELYIYNTTVNAWQYDERYVSLWLKMT